MLFSIEGPVTRLSRASSSSLGLSLFPETLVRPGIDVLGKAALQVVAAERRGAHRAEREAQRVPHIDQLLRHRRRLGEDAEPAERVDALMRGDCSCRHALAADAVNAVAASDE